MLLPLRAVGPIESQAELRLGSVAAVPMSLLGRLRIPSFPGPSGPSRVPSVARRGPCMAVQPGAPLLCVGFTTCAPQGGRLLPGPGVGPGVGGGRGWFSAPQPSLGLKQAPCASPVGAGFPPGSCPLHTRQPNLLAHLPGS